MCNLCFHKKPPIKKCVTEATHEKCITPIVVTQFNERKHYIKKEHTLLPKTKM